MTNPSGPPPPAPGPMPRPAPQRRLYREPDDRKLAGVCSGLGDYLGIDPTIVRLAVVLLTMTTWFGGIFYLVAACLVPKRPATEPRVAAAQPVLPESANTPVVLGLLVAVAVVVAYDRPLFDFPVLGVALVSAGIWLLLRDREPDSVDRNTGSVRTTTVPVEVAPPPGATEEAMEGVDPTPGVATSVPDDSASSADPQGEVPPPVPPWGLGSPTRPFSTPADPAERSDPADPAPPTLVRPVLPPAPAGPRSGAYVLPVLLAAIGVVGLLDLLDLTSPSFGPVVAVALLLVGAAMVLGAFRGRARWLIALGVPAVGLLVLDEIATVPVDAGIGARDVVVAEDGRNTDDHELAVGSLTLDLRDVEGDPGDPPRIEATVGIGELVVLVPDDMEAHVDASVGVGHIAGGDDRGGEVDLRRRFTVARGDDTPEGEGRSVVLDLRVDLGEVEVIDG